MFHSVNEMCSPAKTVVVVFQLCELCAPISTSGAWNILKLPNVSLHKLSCALTFNYTLECPDYRRCSLAMSPPTVSSSRLPYCETFQTYGRELNTKKENQLLSSLFLSNHPNFWDTQIWVWVWWTKHVSFPRWCGEWKTTHLKLYAVRQYARTPTV